VLPPVAAAIPPHLGNRLRDENPDQNGSTTAARAGFRGAGGVRRAVPPDGGSRGLTAAPSATLARSFNRRARVAAMINRIAWIISNAITVMSLDATT
jgi:hypothetical protein